MIYSQNEEELISIGQKLGRLLDSGDIIVLSGDLGAGKTTLTKGIAKGLDISQMIKSPTYTIVREYEGRLPLYHLDVYRIGDDPDSIDLDDFLYGEGVTIIEWGAAPQSWRYRGRYTRHRPPPFAARRRVWAMAPLSP